MDEVSEEGSNFEAHPDYGLEFYFYDTRVVIRGVTVEQPATPFNCPAVLCDAGFIKGPIWIGVESLRTKEGIPLADCFSLRKLYGWTKERNRWRRLTDLERLALCR